MKCILYNRALLLPFRFFYLIFFYYYYNEPGSTSVSLSLLLANLSAEGLCPLSLMRKTNNKKRIKKIENRPSVRLGQLNFLKF
jgi:hypothetical protein